MHCVTNSLYENVLNIAHPILCCGLRFIFRVIIGSAYFICTRCLEDYKGKAMYIVIRSYRNNHQDATV